MDIRTLLFCLVVVNAMLGVFMFVAARVQKVYQGYYYWASSSLLMACGYVLWGLRGRISDLLSVVVAAGVFGVVSWMRLAGIRVFFGAPPRRRLLLAALSLVLAFYWFTCVHDRPVVRVVLMTAYFDALILVTIVEIWRRKTAENAGLYGAMAAVYAFDAFFMTARLLSWFVWPQTAGFLNPSFMNVALFVLQMGVDVMWVVFFFAMNAERMNAELAGAIRAKDAFLHILSHDLRGSAGSLRIGLETFIEEYGRYSEAEKRGMLDMMLNNSRTTCGRLDDLLTWGRCQPGGAPFAPSKARLFDVVRKEFDLLVPAARDKGVALANEIDPEAKVFADPNLLATVVRNLLSNAVKFSHQRGTVRVGLSLTADGALVEVCDEGVGIPKERLSRIFRPECAFTTAGTANESGTGLGLIICAECVRRHGGRIWAERRTPQGARLLFTLPAGA